MGTARLNLVVLYFHYFLKVCLLRNFILSTQYAYASDWLYLLDLDLWSKSQTWRCQCSLKASCLIVYFQGVEHFGHSGYGCQEARADVRNQLGISYTTNHLCATFASPSKRFVELEHLFYQCHFKFLLKTQGKWHPYWFFNVIYMYTTCMFNFKLYILADYNKPQNIRYRYFFVTLLSSKTSLVSFDTLLACILMSNL